MSEPRSYRFIAGCSSRQAPGEGTSAGVRAVSFVLRRKARWGVARFSVPPR